MDRRNFLTSLGAAATASVAGAATLTAKADALEHAMSEALDRRVATPWACSLGGEAPDSGPWLMHDEPRLPKMPDHPMWRSIIWPNNSDLR